MIELTLRIQDEDLCTALLAYPDGRARHEFALDSMRIGILTLQRAKGEIDAERVRSEGDRLLNNLEDLLTHNSAMIDSQLTGTLKEYFDPQSGRFNERVDRILEKDGELQQLLYASVGLENSQLAGTLEAHLGHDSHLGKILDPEAKNGIIGKLECVVGEALQDQRDAVLKEFSLDNPSGALSRLLTKLESTNAKVAEEFSLDDKESALSRMVDQMKTHQRTLTQELSLDSEGSSLARLRREILDLNAAQQERQETFLKAIGKEISSLNARQKEARKSTTHGHDFEDDLADFIEIHSQARGDICTRTNYTTGNIRSCKKGDFVVELGPGHISAGSRIVLEAKQNKSYTRAKALEEIIEARKNRDARIGIFVFSQSSAPANLDAFKLYGDDIVLVWDPEDPSTDVTLLAGLELARALISRQDMARDAQAPDLDCLDQSIREIEDQLKNLDEISKSAGAIQNHSSKIANRARVIRDTLVQQIDNLDHSIKDLHHTLDANNTYE